MITITNLSKSFGRFKALDNLSLQLERGNTVSLLGPNGSGKTTLIKSILGLVIPESGSIAINDAQVKTDFAYRSRIGYMPQIGRYPENMTIKQVINMLKEIRSDHRDHDEELMESFGLPAIQHKTMRSLSGGTRQKVSACLAFLFRPDILILDEPTAGLDPLASELLKDKIVKERNKGKLILITSHVLSDLDEITSHVVYLQDGKLVFYKDVEELKVATGEQKLNKVIATLMQKDFINQHFGV
ncbi:ABC transporter ATP-binding protein [Mucilaginibacter mali]|jgi:Cu-processing system ATP-binding protein|uniref:ABC transporter ATP-binding protein n=1 Tax=Mucilaginibacter mali TaxID=2740462 RepID=A0A7D4QP23_9SPHI|nr:ABC transporter ATP-binding protein [Mucilaginibacter mali]QKJ32970.1 ABC transporter ATP-binding protein [Mucilaginibacter mali]